MGFTFSASINLIGWFWTSISCSGQKWSVLEAWQRSAIHWSIFDLAQATHSGTTRFLMPWDLEPWATLKRNQFLYRSVNQSIPAKVRCGSVHTSEAVDCEYESNKVLILVIKAEIDLQRQHSHAWWSCFRACSHVSHEIESFRTLFNFVQEYSAVSQTKPLNIALFGPRGLGRSFAAMQVARAALRIIGRRSLDFRAPPLNSRGPH